MDNYVIFKLTSGYFGIISSQLLAILLPICLTIKYLHGKVPLKYNINIIYMLLCHQSFL